MLGVLLAAVSWLWLSLGVLAARRSAVTWVAVGYVAMMLVWLWPPTRFVVPLIPIFLWLATRATGARLSAALVVLLGVVLLFTRLRTRTPEVELDAADVERLRRLEDGER